MNTNHLIKPTPQFYIAITAALVVLSWAFSGIVSAMLRPEIDGDAVAYITLVKATNESTYRQMETGARQAQSMTSDPDIRKLADFVARKANLLIRAGSETPEESNSFTGVAKALATGYFNPVMGVEGGLVFVESLFMNSKSIGDRLDSRYQPIFAQYRFSQTVGSILFWICIVGGGGAYFYFRQKYEQYILHYLQAIKFLGLHESASPKNMRTDQST